MKTRIKKPIVLNTGPNLPHIFLLIFYTISATISLVTLLNLCDILKVQSNYSLLLSFFFSVFSIVTGIFLQALLNLSWKAKTDFGKLRENITLKDICSLEGFAKSLCNYFHTSFSSAFCDVKHCIVKLPGIDHYYSNDQVLYEINGNLQKCIDAAYNSKNIVYLGKYKLLGAYNHLYVIPIWQGECIGYIIVFTIQKLIPLIKRMFLEVDHNLIREALFQITLLNKLLISKEIYHEIDAFSDKISRQEYDDIYLYQVDIINYFVKKINCIGGIFISSYSHKIASCFVNTCKNEIDYITNKYSKRNYPTSKALFEEPGITKFTAIMGLPIGIDKPRGVIYLFSDRLDILHRYYDIIDNIENIKLDNDLINLSIQLNLNASEFVLKVI